MSDLIKHECGIALVRLIKPLEYYLSKYGTTLYGLNKLHLLMQKQHNRGQDGAGIANIKLDLEPGHQYISRTCSKESSPIIDIFNKIYKKIKTLSAESSNRLNDIQWIKENLDYTGELFLGHLRYGTYGSYKTSDLHPVVRRNNWMTRNLVLAGNFNMTNIDELLKRLIELGQYPYETSDTNTILEKIGHFLDEENDRLYQIFRKEGFSKQEITHKIAEDMDLQKVLTNASEHWDGGYVIAGLIGHGDAFILRDPSGIRPAFYYHDDEVVVAASERPVIQTAFNVPFESVKEVQPGHALIIKKNGKIGEYLCKDQSERASCSFERIYFSRGTDKEIYQERKNLGRSLVPSVLKSIDYDLENTVFSYIPNTASAAFRGLVEEIESFCDKIKKDRIIELGDRMTKNKLDEILKLKPRIEDVAVKDIKLRTFITQENKRSDLIGYVYDVTYGSVRPGRDNLVVIDDSIVRGTTLKQSIISILDRLGPKKIIVASSAPQIRYPDCYGIDMARLGNLIAFRAAIELLKNKDQTASLINKVYKKAREQEKVQIDKTINVVKEIYEPLTAVQISDKISEMLKTKNINAEVDIIYQTIEDLHASCPNHTGDWYFTGNYPTRGGNHVANRSFINYIEGVDKRAY